MKDYRKYIETYLINKYGKIEDEWQLMIDLLMDNLRQYKEVKEAVETYGLFDPSTFRKNGLISTLKDLQATIIKQCQCLGLSPYHRSKMKNLDNPASDVLTSLLTMEDND